MPDAQTPGVQCRDRVRCDRRGAVGTVHAISTAPTITARTYRSFYPYSSFAFSFGLRIGLSVYGFGVGSGYPYYGYGYPLLRTRIRITATVPYAYPYYGGFYDLALLVRLQVTPREAEVYIDGYYAGNVDNFDGTFQRLSLEPGEHELQLFMPDIAASRRRSICSRGTRSACSTRWSRSAPGNPNPRDRWPAPRSSQVRPEPTRGRIVQTLVDLNAHRPGP